MQFQNSRKYVHKYFPKSWLLGGAIALSTSIALPISAQVLIPLNREAFTSTSTSTAKDSTPNGQISAGWVWLDGRPLFRVSAPEGNLSTRIQDIQRNLNNVLSKYLQQSNESLDLQVKQTNGLTALSINDIYLMSVTEFDTKLHSVAPDTLANDIGQSVRQALITARQERQPQSLLVQGGLAAGAVMAMLLLNWGIRRWRRYIRDSVQQPIADPLPDEPQAITTQIKVRQKNTLKEIQNRLLQGLQVSVWTCGTLVVLNLFPYSRGWLVLLLFGLEVPVKLGMVIFATYLAVRLSYVLVDRFTSTLAQTTLLSTAEDSQRLQLRLSTISGVTKSIATVAGLGIGIITGLVILGVDIGPLLAGAGLIGVALSFASQNVIKDAINGFFILLEDQYAIGDSIAISGYSGLVENINLRITQVRDADGRLITIPNSEIKIVANLSSRWSRANLSIPVGYDTDLDSAIALIREVAGNMTSDKKWREQILETPEVLGVDDFASHSLSVRVWMKTQPSKQLAVAREFRRRLKMAMDSAGIILPSQP
jgi:moderate conductance mechanosensitive channel